MDSESKWPDVSGETITSLVMWLRRLIVALTILAWIVLVLALLWVRGTTYAEQPAAQGHPSDAGQIQYLAGTA